MIGAILIFSGGLAAGWQLRRAYTFHMWRISRAFKEKAKGRR
jgi:hypothetical protein